MRYICFESLLSLSLLLSFLNGQLTRVAVKNSKESSCPVTGLQNGGPLKDLNDSKLIVYESK